MRFRVTMAAVGLLVASGFALGEGLPDGYGTATPSGSKLTTDISTVFDCDDYTFEGYFGQKLKAKVKSAKGSGLVPGMELIRPDGTVVSADSLKKNLEQSLGTTPPATVP